MPGWEQLIPTVMSLFGGNSAGDIANEQWGLQNEEYWRMRPLMDARRAAYMRALANNGTFIEQLRQQVARNPADDPRFAQQYTAGTQAGDRGLDQFGAAARRRLTAMGADPSALASLDAQLAGQRAGLHAQQAGAMHQGIYNEGLARQGRYQAANQSMLGQDPTGAMMALMQNAGQNAQQFGALSGQYWGGIANQLANIDWGSIFGGRRRDQYGGYGYGNPGPYRPNPDGSFS